MLWEKEIYFFKKKGAEQEERERQSVRNYWVQLAELFHLVGLPSSVCGTSDSEIDRGKKIGGGGIRNNGKSIWGEKRDEK